MLSRNIRKEICIRHFIKLESYASISDDLNIHRNTVSNICNLQLKKIKELGLCYSDVNLYDYIDKIVPETKKHIRKVNPATKLLIKSLYLKNEKNHIFKTSEKKILLCYTMILGIQNQYQLQRIKTIILIYRIAVFIM